mgnify:CR=1 FL=1
MVRRRPARRPAPGIGRPVPAYNMTSGAGALREAGTSVRVADQILRGHGHGERRREQQSCREPRNKCVNGFHGTGCSALLGNGQFAHARS